jgi:hypothetical protein
MTEPIEPAPGRLPGWCEATSFNDLVRSRRIFIAGHKLTAVERLRLQVQIMPRGSAEELQALITEAEQDAVSVALRKVHDAMPHDLDGARTIIAQVADEIGVTF